MKLQSLAKFKIDFYRFYQNIMLLHSTAKNKNAVDFVNF